MRFVPLLLVLVFASQGFAQVKDASRRDINILEFSNPGAENSTVKWSCTAGTLTTNTLEPLVGASSFSYTATGSGDRCESELVEIPPGLRGRRCLISARIGGLGLGDYSIQAYDQTDTLIAQGGTSTALGVPATPFDCPVSGSLKFRITSVDPAPGTVLFDQVFIGAQEPITSLCGIDGSTGAGVCAELLVNQFIGPPGTIASPSFAFPGEVDTGLTSANTGEVSLSADTVQTYRCISSECVSEVTHKFQDGVVGTPSVAAEADPETGIYFKGVSGGMGIVADGVEVMGTANTGGSRQAQFLDGSVAFPGISFLNDPDTGLYKEAGNQIAVSTAGARKFRFGETANVSDQNLWLELGSAASPSLTFETDTDTGMYRIAANQTAFTSGGVLSGGFFSGGIFTKTGSASDPGFIFQGDSDTGFYYNSSGEISYTSNGSPSITFESQGIRVLGGSAPSPGYTFGGDEDTGFYRSTTNVAAVAAGGVGAATFAQFQTRLQKPSAGIGSVSACWQGTSGGLNEIGECSSSQRFKEEIVDLPDVDSEKIYDLRAVKFRWKETHGSGGTEDYGFIAEEAYDHLPLLVDTDGSEKNGINYRHMVALLQNELKKLRARVVALENP